MKTSAAIRILGVAIAAVFGMGLATGTAAATTFCVPGFHAACPDSGGNVAEPNLETAMKTDGNDGVPDKVIVAPMTYNGTDSLDTSGTDDLEVIGAGPDQTIISTASTSPVYVVYLNSSPRQVTMRDLKILVPSTAGNNSVALAARDDIFENVDLETRRYNSQAVSPVIEGSTFRDGRIYSTGMGDFGVGFYTGNSGESGRLLLENMRIEGADRAFDVDLTRNPVEIRHSAILDPDENAIGVTGSDLTIDSSVIESGDASPVYAINTTSSEQDIEITNSTIIAAGDPTKPAIVATVQPAAGNAGIEIDVDSSIIRGFMKNWQATSPVGQPGIGDVRIDIQHSNLEAQGTNTGDGTTYVPANNTDADPAFAAPGDYRLTAGSPSIDTGNPATGPGTDLIGAPWPVDGNGDGTAIRDQGAYEYQPPKPVDPDPKPEPDVTAPVISKLKVTGPKGNKAGSIRFVLSEAAKVKAAIKPVMKGKRKGQKPRGLTMSARGTAGINTLKIKRGKLKPGTYKVTVSATDPAGNASRTVSGKLTVRKAKKKG